MFLIDLSVPRNIEPRVDELGDAYLFNIDDLSRVVEQGKLARAHAAEKALELVDDEADRFLASLGQVQINGDIAQMAISAEAIRSAEIGRSKKLVADLDEQQRKALESLTKALVKKLMHRPTMAAREAAKAGDFERARTLLEPWKTDK